MQAADGRTDGQKGNTRRQLPSMPPPKCSQLHILHATLRQQAKAKAKTEAVKGAQRVIAGIA